MKYKLQCIEDGAAGDVIEMDSIEVIPPWGDLIVTISSDVIDRDLEHIRTELERFFGQTRRIAIARAGELKFTLIMPPDSGVSTEGAAWAMEGDNPSGEFTDRGRKAQELQPWDISPSCLL